jgi:hypothetical protein
MHPSKNLYIHAYRLMPQKTWNQFPHPLARCISIAPLPLPTSHLVLDRHGSSSTYLQTDMLLALPFPFSRTIYPHLMLIKRRCRADGGTWSVPRKTCRLGLAGDDACLARAFGRRRAPEERNIYRTSKYCLQTRYAPN